MFQRSHATSGMGEWDELIRRPLTGAPTQAKRGSDAISILGDNRDRRFHAGLAAVLAGTVTSPRDTGNQR